MPELCREFFATQSRDLLTACCGAAQRENQERNKHLRRNKPQWMRQVSREDCNHRARKCHVAECDPFKYSASAPRLRQLSVKSSADFFQDRITLAGIRQSENRLRHHPVFVLLHRALS